jgi:enterochelin esterase-like enzyme
MGGVGCLIMALKHPELFSSVVAFDGAGTDAGDLARANAKKIIASQIKIKVRIGDSFKFVVEGAQKLRAVCSELGIFMAFEELNGIGHIPVIGGQAGKHTNFVKNPVPLADGLYFMFGAFKHQR